MGTGTVERLTREEMARRILTLPADLQADAIKAVDKLYRGTSDGLKKSEPDGPRRDPDQRRAYAGDPWKYIADVFGYRLTPDQEEALALIEKYDRVLLPSANNVGKTHLVSCYALYRFDAVGALPNEDLGLEEQGCLLLLPGPDHDTVYSTIYTAILEQANLAERRGFVMPGERSERSVLWRVRPRWNMEAFSPMTKVGQEVTHTASGRHHRNQIAIIEEGQGVEEAVWRATEGMCSAAGNKIVSPFNPTEPRGAAFQRARGGGWKVKHISALNHPNVRQRSLQVPDAIDFKRIDERVRTQTQDMGSPDDHAPVAVDHEFLYALPPEDETPEQGPRADGIPGHPLGVVRVRRPKSNFTAQVLGHWPTTSSSALFQAAALDEAMARWKARRPPGSMPDVVGIDPARQGKDDTAAAPKWGETAEVLLRAYADMQRTPSKDRPAAMEKLRASRRSYVGEIVIFPKGDGPDLATAMHRRWPLTTFVVDEGGVGSSQYDHLTRVLGAEASPVSFGGSPLPPTPGESWCENMRTQLYYRASLLVAAGLTDVPDDLALREELLAHTTLDRYRVVTEVNPYGADTKRRVPSLLLCEKDKIKDAIGRSPDRADAWVLAVNGDPSPPKRKIEAW